MTTRSSGSTIITIDAQDTLRPFWRALSVYGGVVTLLGVAALAAPTFATLFVEVFLGWLFFVSGVAGLLSLFMAGGATPGRWGGVLAAALASLTGVVLLLRPDDGVIALTVLFAAFFCAEGVLQVHLALAHRRSGSDAWGWMIASGVIDFTLVAIILVGLPATAAWVLGVIVGVNLITTGVATIMVGLAARS